MKQYFVVQKLEWGQLQNFIDQDSRYEGIFKNHSNANDRLIKLKHALEIVYEYGYASANLLMRRLNIGETYALNLMDFMWDQDIIRREGFNPFPLDP